MARGVPCAVDGCETDSHSKGWCMKHYTRWRRHGSPYWEPKHARIPGRTCSAEGCDRPYRRNGLCEMHSQAAKAAARPPIRWCRGCGTRLPENSSRGRRYCGEDCRPSPPALPDEWKPCARCGLPVDMTRRASDGRKRRSDVKMCAHCQRAKYRRGRASLGQIAARDGWGCALCGEPVNPELPGRNAASPSVDHIMPFSLGGSHDLENLQLAHLLCNQIKNNRADVNVVA